MYISNINSSSIKINQISKQRLSTKESHTYTTEGFLMLIYCKKGRSHYRHEDTTYTINENNLLILNPQQAIEIVAEKETSFISIELTGFVFTSSVSLDTLFTHYLMHNRADTLPLYFDLLLLEQGSNHRGTDQIIKRLVECIMIYILRNSDLSIKDNGKLAKANDVMIIQQYIRQNYSKKVTLEALANVTNINKFYLIRIFKQNTGLSPIDYLIHVRIEEAEKLLVNTDYNVATISEKVGFNSPSHFTKAFKTINHLTPSQFRRRHSQPKPIF